MAYKFNMQIHILIKHKIYKLMSVYSLITAEVPTNTNMYLGNSIDYTLIFILCKYMALASESYIPLRHQLPKLF